MLRPAILTTILLSLPAQQKPLHFPASMTEMPSAPDLPADIQKTLLADTSLYSGDTPATLFCQKQDVTDATIDATYRLLCAKVSLGSHEDGFLVMGIGDFRGETSVPYWLFRKTATGYQLVLRTRAEEVVFTSHITAGLHDVDVKHIKKDTPVIEHFLFDGKSYVKKS